MHKVLYQLLLIVGSWEWTVIKQVGAAQSIWQWQLQGGCIPRGGESNNVWCLVAVPSFFLPTFEVTGAASGAYSQALSDGSP